MHVNGTNAKNVNYVLCGLYIVRSCIDL